MESLKRRRYLELKGPALQPGKTAYLRSANSKVRKFTLHNTVLLYDAQRTHRT